MKLALAQINTTVGDLRGNAAKLLDFYGRAVKAGATLVLAPEMAITGYPPRDLLAKRRFVDDNLRALDELTAKIGDAALVVGYVDINPQRPGKEYFNAAALVRNGKILARRFKTLLPTYDVFDEDRYFQPADANAAVEMDKHKLALTICEDIWNGPGYWAVRLYRRDPIEELMRKETGVEVLLNISASPYNLGKEKTRFDMLRAAAIRHKVPLAYCNLVGGNDELVFDGNSMVFDASGNLLAEAAAFKEDLLIVDIAADSPAEASAKAGPLPFKPLDPIEALHEALVLGLRDYTRKCGFKSVVLGLSGGIDSAVTACLAVAALGKENVMGV
jgi:predicted amidohydrolase